jgi:hypothetical protein
VGTDDRRLDYRGPADEPQALGCFRRAIIGVGVLWCAVWLLFAALAFLTGVKHDAGRASVEFFLLFFIAVAGFALAVAAERWRAMKAARILRGGLRRDYKLQSFEMLRRRRLFVGAVVLIAALPLIGYGAYFLVTSFGPSESEIGTLQAQGQTLIRHRRKVQGSRRAIPCVAGGGRRVDAPHLVRVLAV